jgi:hypothetical protein
MNDVADPVDLAPTAAGLCCPRCAGSLGDTNTCPACGAEVDRAALQEWREMGCELGSRWRVFLGTLLVPGRFFGRLPSMRHYVAVPRHLQFYARAMFFGFFAVQVAAVIAALRLGSLLNAVITIPASMAWPLVMGGANHSALRWVHRRLERAGHDDVRAGTERVVTLAQGACVPMALACCLLLVATGSIEASGHRVWHSVELVVALSLYVGTCFWWAWVLMRSLAAETRGLPVRPARVLVSRAPLLMLIPAACAIVSAALLVAAQESLLAAEAAAS